MSIRLALRLSVALAAAMVLPFVDLLALLIPNAAVLFFPAWFQLGKDVPRGFETMGQQLILMFGQMLVLFLGLVARRRRFYAPAFGRLYFCTWPLLGVMLGALPRRSSWPSKRPSASNSWAASSSGLMCPAKCSFRFTPAQLSPAFRPEISGSAGRAT